MARDRDDDRRDDRRGGERREFDNEGRIVLFEQRSKRNPKGPDWSGHCEVNGVRYRLVLWEQEARSGDTFLSGRIEKEESRDDRRDGRRDDRDERDDRRPARSERRDEGRRGEDDRRRDERRDDRRDRDDRARGRDNGLDDDIPF